MCPELIPVYRQSAGWMTYSRKSSTAAVGCHYFPPGLWLPSQPQSITGPWPVPSYTAWWQRHMGVNNLPKVVMQLLPRVGFEPTTCWSQVQRSTRGATVPASYHAIPYHTIVLFQATRPIQRIQLNKKTRRQKISRPTEKNVKTQKTHNRQKMTDKTDRKWIYIHNYTTTSNLTKTLLHTFQRVASDFLALFIRVVLWCISSQTKFTH